jgi:hypothetical protein
MEAESQTTRLPEVSPGVENLDSRICRYARAIERLTWSIQVQYNHAKQQGGPLGLADIDSYLAKIEYYSDSII